MHEADLKTKIPVKAALFLRCRDHPRGVGKPARESGKVFYEAGQLFGRDASSHLRAKDLETQTWLQSAVEGSCEAVNSPPFLVCSLQGQSYLLRLQSKPSGREKPLQQWGVPSTQKRAPGGQPVSITPPTLIGWESASEGFLR